MPVPSEPAHIQESARIPRAYSRRIGTYDAHTGRHQSSERSLGRGLRGSVRRPSSSRAGSIVCALVARFGSFSASPFASAWAMTRAIIRETWPCV